MRVGVDTGGTFTDLVGEDGRVVKVSSTPDAPARAVEHALASLPAPPAVLAHGTTVATNALLERRGPPVALLTTAGFADVLEIARQTRPALYDLHVDRPPPLVDRDHRLEVGGRLDGHGDELERLDASSIPDLPSGVRAVAVCLLHADLDARHERAVAETLRGRGVDVTCSHEVSPEFREYERMVTTVANALLRPVCRTYLER
ncbi:MAG TPA: hydantoinase/oxoprolinase N-terminal domain-containing protein, partial [Acidimicrobiia bacterium]|nr:hydantoinase/oxoprolinase N-terminal domain-containing protein [Acidimicrobiia bacterium]